MTSVSCTFENLNLMSPPNLLFILLLNLVGFLPTPSISGHDPEEHTMRFEMFHIHGKELLGKTISPETRLDHFRELLHLDDMRKKFIKNRTVARRQTAERSDAAAIDDGFSFSTPMGSGRYIGQGVYFVKFKIGTPPQEFLLVADTGSDLTWVHCRYQCPHCPKLGRGPRHRQIFEADKSSSFAPISCTSFSCKEELPFALMRCPTRKTPCVYAYKYMSEAEVWGVFVNESATLTLSNGKDITIKNFTVGCSTSYRSEALSLYEGMLGLGMSSIGFPFIAQSQVKQFSKFSYCLVDHLSPRNISNYLNFGPVTTGPLQYVPLDSTADFTSSFYFIPVVGISVDGTMLKIPRSVWKPKRGGGVILDSGTSLTVLAEPAYKRVYAAVSEPMKKVFKPFVEEDFGFEYCFIVDNVTNSEVKKRTPNLVIHFQDNAKFEPHWKSYIIEVSEGIKCLGFQKGEWPGHSIIGNILQQEFFWEFDLFEQKVGFAPNNCASPHK